MLRISFRPSDAANKSFDMKFVFIYLLRGLGRAQRTFKNVQ